MDYKKKTLGGFNRTLKEGEDEFGKFILFYISLEVLTKLKIFSSIRTIKKNIIIRNHFFSNINKNDLLVLKQKLDINPLKNMKQEGDLRWKGKLDSKEDFDGIVEFIIRGRNNLFHGDKILNDERENFIVTQGNLISEPLIEGVINNNI